MNFVESERARAAGRKRTTSTLPDAARVPAKYVDKTGGTRGADLPFCLPPDFATASLLPEVRHESLALFDELGIPWHAGVGGGPSNHLLSSQVQCVNALGQMTGDPNRLRLAFGDPLEVDVPLEIEPGRFLTFEYIGPTDFFGEQPHGDRTRGANCTSADAAFLHRHIDGVTELVLLEWKYTESYRPRPADAGKTDIRRRRYEAALTAADGPVDAGLFPFDLMTDEPLYQLMRQQLLAHELEKAHVLGADRVVVAHVSMPANVPYQASLSRDEHRAVGATVDAVWQRLLRRPDRFVSLNAAMFLDPAITSVEYVQRYGDDVIGDHSDLLEVWGARDSDELESALYADIEFDGSVRVDPGSVSLQLADRATDLTFPFTRREFRDAAEDLGQRDRQRRLTECSRTGIVAARSI